MSSDSSPVTAQNPEPVTSTSLQTHRPRLLRFAEVRQRTGLSRSTIWRLEALGAFPRHRQLTVGTVGWVESEIDHWIGARVSDRVT